MSPNTRPALWPEIKPGRLAATLRNTPAGCRCALLGLPDDLGVRLNGGRTGARNGPAALRAALASFGVGYDGVLGRGLDVGIFDAGDVEVAAGDTKDALLETHRRVEAAVAELQARGLVTICVGGGHDLALPALRAVATQREAMLGGVNLDAHLDVRERVGSGMPFRRLIVGQQLDPRRFVEVGVARFSNDRRDLEWLRAQGARLVPVEAVLDGGLNVPEVLTAACRGGPAFLSVDLDGLDQSVAPGVSAPNPMGVDVRTASRLAEAAGARPEIVHFDLMELNPKFDVDGRTARTCALLLSYFVAGLAQRPGAGS